MPSEALAEGRDMTIYLSQALHQLICTAFVVLELQEIQVVPVMLALVSLHGITLGRVDGPPDLPLLFLGTVLI